MIITVTPNPCVDKTYVTEKFDIYDMNRVAFVRADCGGKGINVSSALKCLGADTMCLGFDFVESDPSPLGKSLDEKGIPYDFVKVEGHLRNCMKIFDKSISHTVEINEYGAPVKPEDGERLIEKTAQNAAKASFVTLSGSLPAGLGEDFYANCVKRIKSASPGCKVVCDSEKKLLLRAVAESPFMIKPNIFEFNSTFGCGVKTVSELDSAAKRVASEYGISVVCVSLGKDGSYVTDGKTSYVCEAPETVVRSIQGAGDSMIAGMCFAFEKGADVTDAIRTGAASAAVSVSKEGVGFGTFDEIEKVLSAGVKVTKL